MARSSPDTRSTIRTVAHQAGCSVATVSRVINRSGPASAEARSRVEAAVDQLGFVPSDLGRSLRAKRTTAVGVIVPSFTNPVFADSVSGLEAIARSERRHLLVAATDYEAAREVEVVEALLRQRVEGLVLTVADAERSAALDRLDREGVPHVLVYNQPLRGRAAVTVDNRAASAELTRRFLAHGHRRLAYVAGRFRTTDRSRMRFEGTEAVLATAGLDPAGLIELDYLDSIEGHAAALRAALSGPGRPTGLLCSNDLLAISVIAALRSLGIAVPDQVSVAGFDGIGLGRMLHPSLATVATPTVDMGRLAMRRLLEFISGKAPVHPTVELLPFEFRPGGSLAPVPGENAGGGERRRPIRRN
ncbi:MAG: LacI family DNA-binding transcriptional regulator [Hyphomicrobiaceae bacterium]